MSVIHDMLKIIYPSKQLSSKLLPERNAWHVLHFAGPDTEKNDLNATKLSESDTNGSNDPVTPSFLHNNQVQHVRFCSFVVTDAGWNNDSIIPIQNFRMNFRKLKHHVHYSSQLEPDHFQNLFVIPTRAMRKTLVVSGKLGILLPSYVAITDYNRKL